MDRDELADWLRLTLTPGIGDASARRLLAAFGLPAGIFGQPIAALREIVTPAQAAALRQAPEGLAAQIGLTLRWLQEVEPDGAVRRLVTLGDAAYPTSLLETADPPVLLYLLGAAEFDLTQLGRSLAIVGSRNPTPQGEANARAFARAFVEAGLPIVSGLA
ncbi:MAG: DNA-processing protein DprA, partial [Variovorax sp.]